MNETINPAQAPNGDWPGAFGLYRTAKQATKLNLSTILILIAIFVAISIVLGLLFPDHTLATSHDHAWRITFSPANILSLLITPIFVPALISTLLASVDGTTFSFDQARKLFGKNYLNILGLILLSDLITSLSLVLLVIPFFFITPRLVLSSYFLVEGKLGPIRALKASWHATSGNVGKIYGIFGAMFAMALLMITIIGIPFAIYFIFMYCTATTLLYRHITGKPVRYISKA